MGTNITGTKLTAHLAGCCESEEEALFGARMARMNGVRVQVPLRWSDVDAYGHVNNVELLRLVEQARVLAFDRLGALGEAIVAGGLLVAAQRIEYLRPVLYRVAPIEIDVWVTRLDVAWFDLAYDLRDGDAPAARAETTMAVYDLAAGRPRRLAAAERAALEAWRDEPISWRRVGRR